MDSNSREKWQYDSKNLKELELTQTVNENDKETQTVKEVTQIKKKESGYGYGLFMW